MTRVALLRCEKLPSFVDWEIPNLEELFEEDRLLQRGFESQGFEAESVIWNDPRVKWDRFDAALIRSTWDYLDEQALFLRVLSQIEGSSCRLFNPLDAVRWNMDKHYLFDLETWGMPIVPTLLASTLEPDTLRDLFPDRQGLSVILKPAVGLGGAYSHRVPVEELPDALSRLQADHPGREYLIQPFVENVVLEGEWSFSYFDGQLSHVLLKKPAPNDYRVQGIYGGSVQVVEPLLQDFMQAESVIAKLPFDVLYARLDFVRVGKQLSIIELELIEPIFSFNLVPDGITRLVDATGLRLAMRS